MSSSDPLEQLLDPDSLSRGEFPTQLANVLLVEDCMNRAQTLPVSQLTKFVEGLDRGLEVLDPTGHVFDRCLFELRRVCGTRKVLPVSHILSKIHFELGKKVASGVTADVYEGWLKGSKVRIKKVRVYLIDDPEKLELFYHEAVVWKHVHHQNIVPFHGATLNPHQLVFDWMEYGNLTGFLKEHPNANPLGLLNDIAEGLNYLHFRNVIHGSISGASILVDQLGRARVGDFTFATIATSQDTLQGTHCGATVLDNLPARWTAPEVLNEKRPLSKKSDVFSFAMVMYAVFAGEVPFEGLPNFTSIVKVNDGERPKRPINSFLTDVVWELMQKCWKHKANSRPEMLTVLQELTPSLLRSLCQPIENLPEFQVALGQFYGSIQRKACIDRLRGAELKKFINLLDDVLRIEGLGEDLRRHTLQNLWEVCGQRFLLPDSCLLPRQVSKVSAKPEAESGYAEVWKGKTGPGAGGGGTMVVCIKVMKSKGHKEFYGDVALWAKLDHPNIVRCFGMASNALHIVTEWMPNGHVMKYAENQQAPVRVSLLIDIARGLKYLHSCGVVHGNLKQENILLDARNNARLSDVGFAKLTPVGESKFDWAQADNGCRWAAPEIFQKGEFTTQSDAFSYGFIAAEVFLGRPLWKESDEMGVRAKMLDGQRPSRPRDKEKYAYTIELWRMFGLCWVNDSASRTSTSEVLQVLEHLPLGDSYLLKKAAEQGNGKDCTALIDELDNRLDTCMVFPKERPVVLNRLCKNCDVNRSLPRSMIIEEASLRIKSGLPENGGGFGDVYRGEFGGHLVAVKRMKLWASSDLDDFLSRFCREAVAWRHLRHPNVLPLYGATFDIQKPRFQLVSEWMKNGDINNFITKNGDVNRVQLLMDVAHGLQYLHSFNFVHGDLKGANILIKDDNRACLADFGLSTITYAISRTSGNVATGFSTGLKTTLMHYSSGGTDRWTSPELLFPEHFGLSETRPTKESDCYALGMVVYEVLCGKLPFWDLKCNIVHAISEGRKPSKPDNAAELGFTDMLWWTIDCCWQRDRDMRPDVGTVLSRLADASWAWNMRRRPVKTSSQEWNTSNVGTQSLSGA